MNIIKNVIFVGPIFFCFFFLAGCSFSPSDRDRKFSQEEIEQLSLDSTGIIRLAEDDKEVIDLEEFTEDKTFNIGEQIQDVMVLPLRTDSTTASLLTRIDDVVMTDSFVYVKDNIHGGEIAIFDKSGIFVSRISVGEGPDKIGGAKDFKFNQRDNVLQVLNNHYMSFFTPRGDFLYKERIPLNAYSFAIIPTGYLFYAISGLYNDHIDKEVKNQIYQTDATYQLKYKGFPYKYGKDNNYEGGSRYLKSQSGTHSFSFKFDNNIYRYIDNGRVSAKFELNFREKGIPHHLLKGKIAMLLNALRNNDYYFYLGDYCENSSHSFIKILNLYRGQYTFVYRDNTNGVCLGGNQIKLERTFLPPINEPISSYGDYFISYFFPNDENLKLLNAGYLSEETVAYLRKMPSDDNPVLVFFKLKDFNK